MRFSLLALGAACTFESAVLAGRGGSLAAPPLVCHYVPPAGSSAAADAALTSEPGRRRSSAAQPRDTSALVKGGGSVTFNSNCKAAPPADSKYNKKNGFPTMESVLLAAYNDAVRMADYAQNVENAATGLRHYFGRPFFSGQLGNFEAMMETISSSNITYSIEFSCVDAKGYCHPHSVFLTDSSPAAPGQRKTIVACPEFWVGPSTSYLLYNASVANASAPPYRDNSATGWCAKNTTAQGIALSQQQDQFFYTAGAAVLRELTQLDALGVAIGLTAVNGDGTSHGAECYQGGCEFRGARQFLVQWHALRTADTSPNYNAESYSAAASELWFQRLCLFDEIIPAVFFP